MDASIGDRETADEGSSVTAGEGPSATPDEGPPPADVSDGSDPAILESGRHRRRAVLYSLPFLLLGIGSALLILSWGLEPLWAFLLLPPILFMTGLTYLVFSTDFLEDR